jgi:hypothetical protein
LETIGSGTGQHLVDSDDVVGMTSNSHVESILATNLGQVLVCADSAGFKCFGGKLFIFIRDEMDTERELVYTSLFASQIKNTNLPR